MALYLKNAVYVDWQSLEFKKTHMKIHDGVDAPVEFLSVTKSLDPPVGSEVIDCTGKIVTKAFGCGHHHVYSALARGMSAPKKNPENFYEILKYIWWTLDKCLDLDMIESSALVTALYCAKNGVTFVIDHHASPFAVPGSLETIAKAFDRVGVSHLLCYEMSNRDGETSTQQGLEETENYLKSGRQGLVGLHASFTVDESLLENAVALAEKYNSGIHVHAAEDKVDQEYCQKDYRKRVIQRFHDAGALNFEKTILGHCLHLEPGERELLKNSPAYIAQNTESNLNNNVGMFDHRGLNEEKILLGTDGMHSDMIRSAKAAYFCGQAYGGVSPLDIYRRFRNVHRYLSQNRFSGDGDNNLVILDYDSPTEINPANFCGHFIYGIEARHIERVISNGHLIVDQGRILTVDETEILAKAHEQATKLWQLMEK